jgi:hypothetical protein
MSEMFSMARSFNQPLYFDTINVTDMSLMFYKAVNYNQPVYFKLNDDIYNYDIFENSPMHGQESKYLLEPQFYSKLLLFYTLNQINPELLYLCDEFEEFF